MATCLQPRTRSMTMTSICWCSIPVRYARTQPNACMAPSADSIASNWFGRTCRSPLAAAWPSLTARRSRILRHGFPRCSVPRTSKICPSCWIRIVRPARRRSRSLNNCGSSRASFPPPAPPASARGWRFPWAAITPARSASCPPREARKRTAAPVTFLMRFANVWPMVPRRLRFSART